MVAEYWQRGESVDYTNAGASVIRYGDVVPLGTRIGVAGCDVPVGATGSLHVAGVFILPKTAGTAMTVGEEVFWDETSQSVIASGTLPAGWVVEPATADAANVKVKVG